MSQKSAPIAVAAILSALFVAGIIFAQASDLQQQARIEKLPPDTGKIVCIGKEDCQRFINPKETTSFNYDSAGNPTNITLTAPPPLASAHAASPAPAVKCKDTVDYIKGHDVLTSVCTSVSDGGTVIEEQWSKDGKLDRADGPAEFERDPEGNTREHWWKDGKEIAPPRAANVPEEKPSSAAWGVEYDSTDLPYEKRSSRPAWGIEGGR